MLRAHPGGGLCRRTRAQGLRGRWRPPPLARARVCARAPRGPLSGLLLGRAEPAAPPVLPLQTRAHLGICSLHLGQEKNEGCEAGDPFRKLSCEQGWPETALDGQPRCRGGMPYSGALGPSEPGDGGQLLVGLPQKMARLSPGAKLCGEPAHRPEEAGGPSLTAFPSGLAGAGSFPIWR